MLRSVVLCLYALYNIPHVFILFCHHISQVQSIETRFVFLLLVVFVVVVFCFVRSFFLEAVYELRSVNVENGFNISAMNNEKTSNASQTKE